MKKTNFAFFVGLLTIISSCVNNSEPVIKTRLRGAWRCVEYIPTLAAPRTYIVEIDPLKTDTNQYIISNFFAAGENEFVFSKFSGTTLKITDNQSIGATQMILKLGSGTVSTDLNQIDLYYKVFDGLNDVDVYAVFSR